MPLRICSISLTSSSDEIYDRIIKLEIAEVITIRREVQLTTKGYVIFPTQQKPKQTKIAAVFHY